MSEVETPRDRVALAQDAGVGSVSIASVFAGSFVALGAVVLLLALAAAIVGGSVDVRSTSWIDASGAATAILAGALLLSFLFGGYTAGRMARRRGVLHGMLVVITTLVGAGVAVVVARLLTNADADTILRNLRSVGVPTTGSEWSHLVTVSGIVALVAVIAGALVGGAWGERWHTRLMRRALDPDVGREGTLRRDAATAHDDAVSRVDKTRVGGGVDVTDRATAPTSDTSDDDEKADVATAGRGRRRFGRG